MIHPSKHMESGEMSQTILDISTYQIFHRHLLDLWQTQIHHSIFEMVVQIKLSWRHDSDISSSNV